MRPRVKSKSKANTEVFMDTSTPIASPKVSRRLDRIRILQGGITRRINDGTNYEQILDFIFESFSTLIPFDRIGIAVLENKNETVTIKWRRSNLDGENLQVGYSAPLKGSSLETMLKTGKPRIINDLHQYFLEHPHSTSTAAALADGIRSSLTLPLRAGGESVGFIFFSSGKTHTYAESHLVLFREVAEDLSMMVQYGRLTETFAERRWPSVLCERPSMI